MRQYLTLASALFVLCACSDNDGATEPTGTSVLSIAGNWRGTWRQSTVTMTLQQAGTSVTGSLNDSREMFDLTGEVDEFGVFRFAATTTTPGGCNTFNSTGPNHVPISNMATMMDGVMARRSRTDCEGGRTLVETGSIVAEKTS